MQLKRNKRADDLHEAMLEMGRAARAAARELARAETGVKNQALAAMAAQSRSDARGILEANARDVAKAKKPAATRRSSTA